MFEFAPWCMSMLLLPVYCYDQIMYDNNSAGQHLRRHVGVSLAWWHSYKWATFRICTVFGSDFIGPLFHNLFPERAYNVKLMSFPSATAILSYMRLAYPSVKDQLMAAIAMGNSVSKPCMVLLQNLQDLLEYFIPTVLFVCCFCLCNNICLASV